jgi:hypothetical protein
MKKNQTKKKYKLLANLILITILVSSSIAVGEKITEKDTRLEKEENSFINQVVADLTEPLKDYPNISISSSGLVIDGLFYEFDEIQEPKLVDRNTKSKGNEVSIIEESTVGVIYLKNNDPQQQPVPKIIRGSYLVRLNYGSITQFYTWALGYFIFFGDFNFLIDFSRGWCRFGWEKKYFDSYGHIESIGGYLRADGRYRNIWSNENWYSYAKIWVLPDGRILPHGDIYQI